MTSTSGNWVRFIQTSLHPPPSLNSDCKLAAPLVNEVRTRRVNLASSEAARGMINPWIWVAGTSSALLRLCSYVFFRWIPGDLLPTLIASLFVVYVYSFYTIWVQAFRNNDPTDQHRNAADSQQKAERSSHEAESLHGARKHPLSILLSGLPSRASRLWTGATFFVNVTLFCGVLDLTFRAAWLHPVLDISFARLGHVSDSSAKVFIREPNTTQLPIHLSYRYADSPLLSALEPPPDATWKHGPRIDTLRSAEDWTAVIEISQLEPDTRYQWILSNNFSGHFITAPRPGGFSARSARLDPSSPRTRSFTFLHSSCIIPNFPYNPLDHPLGIPGFKHLSGKLAALKPAFFLFLGDFIYIDVPRRHGSDIETYRRHYRQVYASPDWPGVATVRSRGEHASYQSYDLPWLHVWDDHEISNDWSRNTTPPYSAALDPYQHYHLAANPPLHSAKNSRFSPTYYTFTQGPVASFVMDTRRYRSSPNLATSTMLGAQQLHDLKAWLAREEPSGVRWKVVVSSVPFTRNWRVNGQDTWAGYLAERRQVLDAMWAVNAPARLARRDGVGVVVLSGDRHEHATTAFPPPPGSPAGPEATVHEFSTSPLNMFYLPIRTYREEYALVPSMRTGGAAQDGEQDVCIHYEPEGNSKFGAVTVEDSTGSGQSVLRYRLFVDGVETWSHVLVAPERRAGNKGRERWREGVWD